MENYGNEQMRTLSEVMNKMKAKGYDTELKWSEKGILKNEKAAKAYRPDDLKIIKTFRFEGDSNPSDNAVLFLLKDKEDNISYLLDSYGMYSKEEGEGFDEFVKQIPKTNELEDFDSEL